MKLKLNRSKLTIQNHQCRDSDEVLEQFHLSRKTRYHYYQSRAIQVGNVVLNAKTELHPDDLIQITLCSEEDEVIPWFEDIEVLYEDELFLIVNKPAHMLVHSDGVNQEHTLCNLVKAYYICQQIHAPVRPLHRLDVETSGIVVFCKLPFFQPLLDSMLRKKKIQRQYMALVEGKLPNKKMTITRAIARDRHDARKMRVSNQGKDARTTIYLEKQYPGYALIRCQLHTGRTHQIRVHLASIHHPLLSDPLYGEVDARIDRLALHAFRVKLYHPLLQKELTIDCPIPDDMRRLL